jgi:hypothetical protein
MKLPCCLCLCIPHNFLVFYAVSVVSKESRLLVLPRNACNIIHVPASRTPK